MSASSVSVIIPAYNAAATIERAVESVVGQIGLREIIIVDDCSVDETVSVVHKLAGKIHFVKLVRHNVNCGASETRNSGIAIAAGEYLAFLDADDIWLPGKLHKQLEHIVNRENVSLVTCDTLQLSPKGEVLKRGHSNRVPVSGCSAWKTLLSYNFIPTPTVLVRKRDVLSVGGFSRDLQVAEDLDLWIRIAMRGEVAVIPEVFVHYYDYSGSLMKSKGEKTEDIIMSMIKKHIRNNQQKLTVSEIRYIYGYRYYEFGLQRFFRNDPAGAMSFFTKAVKERFLVVKSLQYILRAFFLCSIKRLTQ